MEIGPFEAYFQPDPNVVVLRGQGQHVIVTSRLGQVHDFMLQDAAEVAEQCIAFEKAMPNVRLRLRSYWGDNAHGNGLARVDVLYPKGMEIDPRMFDFATQSRNGQSITVSIEPHLVNLDADRFEPNSTTFYTPKSS